MNLYSYIKHLADEYGTTVHKLNKRLGFGGATINGWNTHLPDVLKCYKVAKFFGMTLDEFVKGAQDYEDEQ